ncbi:hypothetical protein BDQ12DRAFT_205252 [Crucibulum laeve]|uniref:Alpha-ketoglutarate-dependent dioxygenase AlkB-like domain-containing protein n=1 Tax=Crucibulum laeve TaxID=68775 RepID=A0A5C3MRQ8_9AGAR|nr:hypothetical protein BDQ12DRAFT_205252 [Crucibulum laeve]
MLSTASLSKRKRGLSNHSETKDIPPSPKIQIDNTRRKRLRIEIPLYLTNPDSSCLSAEQSYSPSSLFSANSPTSPGTLFDKLIAIDSNCTTASLTSLKTVNSPEFVRNTKPLPTVLTDPPSQKDSDESSPRSPSSLFSAESQVCPGILFDELAASKSNLTTATSTSPKTDNNPGPVCETKLVPALLTGPPIPGLFYEPELRIPKELADEVMRYCMTTYFQSPSVNQVMLFGRFSSFSSSAGLPPILLSLLDELSSSLRPWLPKSTYELLFPPVATQARQAIINLYKRGEGITPHVDLLGRYGDGIIGVSFGSGCTMRFDKFPSPVGSTNSSEIEHDMVERWDVYLPERSVIILSEDARYKWTHGIDKREEDYVSLLPGNISSSNPRSDQQERDQPGLESDLVPRTQIGRWIQRNMRLSVTFRWMLPGADIVGEA